MSAQRIIVLGGGFAGLWSAVGAARKLDELRIGPERVRVTLVNRDPYHSIRVRNYESDLTPLRVPLADVLDPIDVECLVAEVIGINPISRSIAIRGSRGDQTLKYDRLVFALGSQLRRPDIPGLLENAFDIDTYAGAERLDRHLHELAALPSAPGLFSVVVVGAGLTGIELATELPQRLRALLDQAGRTDPLRIILVDRNPQVGSDMGDSARPVIEEALHALDIDTRLGAQVSAITPSGVTLGNGEFLPAATVVWCAGMQAHPLTRAFPVAHDFAGRLPVDEYLRVEGVRNVFAAGDVARIMLDQGHPSVMSCQHGRPMGRFAGHNVVCDLVGLPMLPLKIDYYVTVLDLGPQGAVYTEGWDRHVVSQGEAAKNTKRVINTQRIYPPASRNRREILDAAAPVVQPAPAKGR